MQDFQSKNTGNSRYLKSVSDFLTQYPTYNDFAAALVAGTLPVDFNGINSAGVNERGTPLNKANLLTDATAALFGLNSSATVNQVFSLLGGAFGSASSYFGVCTDSGPNFSVTVSDKFALEDGARVSVFFYQHSWEKQNIRLNVNGTGNKRIRLRHGPTTTYREWDGSPNKDQPAADWGNNQIVEFVYYDEYWLETAPHNVLTFSSAFYTGNGKYGSSSSNRSNQFFLGCQPVWGVIQSNENPNEYATMLWPTFSTASTFLYHNLSNGNEGTFEIYDGTAAGYFRTGNGANATIQMNETNVRYLISVIGTDYSVQYRRYES